jgi:hypothetical protein
MHREPGTEEILLMPMLMAFVIMPQPLKMETDPMVKAKGADKDFGTVMDGIKPIH